MKEGIERGGKEGMERRWGRGREKERGISRVISVVKLSGINGNN